MTIQPTFRRSLLSLAGALALGAVLAMPAGATDANYTNSSVNQTITGGALTASIASASMPDVTYSNIVGGTTGLLHLVVNDARGTSVGWNVTVASTNFVYGGTSATGKAIPNTGFSITSAHVPIYVAGDSANVPHAQEIGSLDTARTTIVADAGKGSGVYGQDLDVALVVPPFSQTGAYTAALTVTFNAAP